MSRVLQQLGLSYHRKLLLKCFVYQCGRREFSGGSGKRSSHSWKIAVASCTVGTMAGGSFIWWKWKDLRKEQSKGFNDKKSETDNARIIERSKPFGLSGGNLILQKCSHNAEVEDLSTSPWLESREPSISKEALNKQISEAINTAIRKTNDLCWRIKDESGCPGLVVAVSVDGKIVHQTGFGYSDVENRILAVPETVMRIASISKPITMAAAAKLWEQGKLDLDKPIEHYVPAWPSKVVDGEEQEEKTQEKGKEGKGKDKEKQAMEAEFEFQEYYLKKYFPNVKAALGLFKDDKLCSKPGTEFLYTTHGWTLISAVIEGASGKTYPQMVKDLLKELGMENTYLDENDPIIYKRARFYKRNSAGRLFNVPFVDCSYKYAGGGLLSNVRDLTRFGNAMLYSYQSDIWDKGYHDDNAVTSGNRDNEKVAKVDNPIQTQDIFEFANNSNNNNSKDSNLMPSDEHKQNNSNFRKLVPADSTSKKETKALTRYVKPKEVFLRSSTVKEMWTPVKGTQMTWDRDSEGAGYGMGWGVVPHKSKPGTVDDQRFYVSHTGGAIGASSVLLIMPTDTDHVTRNNNKVLDLEQPFMVQTQGPHPRGIVVTMLCNMQAVGLNKTALRIAKLFVEADKNIRQLEDHQKNKRSSQVDRRLETCTI